MGEEDLQQEEEVQDSEAANREPVEGEEAAEEASRPPEEVVQEVREIAREAGAAAEEASEKAVARREEASRTAAEDQESAALQAREAADATGRALERVTQALTTIKEVAEELSLRDVLLQNPDEAENPVEARAALMEHDATKALVGNTSADVEAVLQEVARLDAIAKGAAEAAEGMYAAATQKAALWTQAQIYLKQERPKSAVVFLHGLGEIETVWSEVIPPAVVVPPQVQPCRWIWPRADLSPCTAFGNAPMLQWFDVPELPVCEVVRGVPDRKRIDEDPEQVASAVRAVHAAVAALEAEGISSRKIAVGGFGQGAALAAHAVLRYNRPLAGAVMLSGWLPCIRELEEHATPAGRAAKILWVHGALDRVVHSRAAVAHLRALQALGPTVVFKLMPELAFGVNEEVLACFQRWLSARLEEEEAPLADPPEEEQPEGDVDNPQEEASPEETPG